MSQQLQPQSTETTTALLGQDLDASALSRSRGIPSRPVARLPLRRIVPQDVHAALDYGGGSACMVAAILTHAPSAKVTAGVLASTSAGVSLLTDSSPTTARSAASPGGHLDKARRPRAR